MLYERPEYKLKGQDQNRRCRIETARLANGEYGVGIKHDKYLIFLSPNQAAGFAERIINTITEAKDRNATETRPRASEET